LLRGLPPSVLALGLCSRALGGAVLDALGAVLAVLGAPRLANKEPPAGFVRAGSVFRVLGDVVEQFEADDGVERYFDMRAEREGTIEPRSGAFAFF
jgi:hypothetical protein